MHIAEAAVSSLWLKYPPPTFEATERLFVWFSNNRRIEVLVLLVVLFIFGLIVIGVSRRQRAYDSGQVPKG